MMLPLPLLLRRYAPLFFPFRMRPGLFPMLMVLFRQPPLALRLVSPGLILPLLVPPFLCSSAGDGQRQHRYGQQHHPTIEHA
jgi:hypothetical protein